MSGAPDGLQAPASLDRTLARGMFVVGLFAVSAGLARVAQDAGIAWRFGTGPVVDAYYFVTSLANWPVAMALSALTLLVVPLEAKLRETGRVDVGRFRGELLAGVAVSAAVALPLAAWALATIAGGPLGGLQPLAAQYALAGVPEIAALVPAGFVGALFAAWLVAAGRHRLTLFETIPPLLVLACVLLLPGRVLFWATAVGVALQAGVMAVALAADGALPAPRWRFASPAWRGLGGGVLLLVAAQAVYAFVPLVDAFFAARLGDGTLATLNFANRMVLGAQGVAAIALQRVGLPLLSQLGATAPGRVRATALRWAAIMGCGGVLAAALVAALADPIVALLFERGSFTAADRLQVATLLRWGMLQLPPFLAGMALVNALASGGATGWIALAACAGVVVKVAASAALAASHGAVGLQVATALMYTATALLAWAALGRRTPRQPKGKE